MKKIFLFIAALILFAGSAWAADYYGGVRTLATDTLFDAAGDTVYGTGDNTSARLAAGTAYQVYMMNAAATAPAWTSTLGVTGTRLTKGWFTDLEISNYPTVGGVAVFDQAVTSASNPVFSTLNLTGASSLGLGTAGSLVGSINMKNATSGSITIQPITGALGTPTLVLGTTFTDAKWCSYTTAAGLTCNASIPLAADGSVTLTGVLTPSAAGGVGLGTASLPFSQIVLGTVATNNTIVKDGTPSSAIEIVLPSTGGTLALAATPIVAGGSADLNLTAAQVSGTIVSNTGQGANDRNHTLPTAAAGLNFIGIVGEAQAASYYRFTAGTADTMCLDGTCGKDYVSIAAPTRGAMVSCYSMQVAATGLMTTPTLAIGTSAKTAVASAGFAYDVDGGGYSKVAAETAPGNDVIPQNKYGAVGFEIGADGTIDAIEATDNATGYDSSALAIAAIPAVSASHTRLGVVSAMSTDVGGFTFGTTELDDANSTVSIISASVYSRPYHWICLKNAGTWATD